MMAASSGCHWWCLLYVLCLQSYAQDGASQGIIGPVDTRCPLQVSAAATEIVNRLNSLCCSKQRHSVVGGRHRRVQGGCLLSKCSADCAKLLVPILEHCHGDVASAIQHASGVTAFIQTCRQTPAAISEDTECVASNKARRGELPPCDKDTKAGSLCSANVASLHPTQSCIGALIKNCKKDKLNGKSKAKLHKYLDKAKHIVPAVIGPGGLAYITDHHHMSRALYDSRYGTTSEAVVTVCAVRSLMASESAPASPAFWGKMLQAHKVWPYNRKGEKYTSDQQLANAIPRSIATLIDDDPYRSFSYYVRESWGYIKCEPAPEPTAQLPECLHKPQPELFLEFTWANFLRKTVDLKGLFGQPIYELRPNQQVEPMKKALASAVKIAVSKTAIAQGLPGINRHSEQHLQSLTTNPHSGCITDEKPTWEHKRAAAAGSSDQPLCSLSQIYFSEANGKGSPEDYMELYNAGPSCNLKGWTLADNADHRPDLVFADVVIASRGYWLGYKDGAQDKFGRGDSYSFRRGVSKNGETLYLSTPGGHARRGNTRTVKLGKTSARRAQCFGKTGRACYCEPTPGTKNGHCL